MMTAMIAATMLSAAFDYDEPVVCYHCREVVRAKHQLDVAPIAPLYSGWVSQYSPGVFQTVINNRLAWQQLPWSVHDHTAIAVLECNRLGEVGTIIWANGETESYMVADCANPAHIETIEWMTTNSIAFEVGYETALRRGFVGTGGVYAELQVSP